MNKQNKKRWVAACLCGAFLLTGLTGCNSQQQAIDFVTVEDGDIAVAQLEQAADFSYELFRQSAAQQQTDVLLSPLSAWLALSMTGQGAEGATADAFTQFFEGTTPEQQALMAAWILQDLEQQLSGSTKLTLANSVWCDDAITVEHDFLRDVQQYYRALIVSQDLQGADAVRRVNGWIAKATDNRIPSMLDTIDDDAVLLLINALTMDASWQSSFTKEWTRSDSFYRSDGSQVQLDFMSQEYKHADYLQWEQGQGMVLPYDDGRLALVALLPDETSDCDELLQQLSGSWISDLLTNKTQTAVQLWLPKFEMNSKRNLNEVCKQMGLELAFDGEQADFSGIGTSENGNICIGNVLQNCQLKVDEDGTQAAAATVVEIVKTSAIEVVVPPIELRMNRPFVYLVLDQKTQLPLFTGIYQGEQS